MANDLAASGDVQDARPLTDAELAKLNELADQITKFESQRRWSDMIKAVLAQAEIHTEPAEKVALYSRAGSLYLEKSSNQAEAIKCFDQVLKLDPTNLEAIHRLKEMYEKRRDWERLLAVSRAECEMLDPDDRALRYLELARLATEKVRKPEVNIELWRLVLDQDPENPEALDALSKLYKAAREWEPLAQILESQAAATADRTKLLGVLQELGVIYADKLSQDEGAVSVFRRVLELDPNDKRAQDQLKKRYVTLRRWDDLEAFYEGTDKWDELIRTLERETENKDLSTEDRVQVFFRIARLWQGKKQKTDRAARAYERVLELDAGNLDAALALAPIYEAAGDAKKLAGVIEIRLSHVDDPIERVTLLTEAGDLYAGKLKDPGLAYERYLSAFAIEPSNETVRENVERAAGATGAWDKAIGAYEKAIESAQYADDKLDLKKRLGTILITAGQSDAAMSRFQEVYDERPEDIDVLRSLEELYRGANRFDALLAVYKKRIGLESEPGERRRLSYEIARLEETALKDRSGAIDSYRAIIDEWGTEEVDAFRSLERLYEEGEKWPEFVDVLEKRIDLGPESDEELASLKFRLARVLETKLTDKTRALDLYREILMLMPDHEGARSGLEGLLTDRDLGMTAAETLEPIYDVGTDGEALVRVLEVLYAGSESDADARVRYATKIGSVSLERLNDARRAFDGYARALRAEPSTEGLNEKLYSLASANSAWADLVALFSELARESTDPTLGRSFWLRAAQLHDQHRGDIDAAVAAYQQILDADANDAEVIGALEELYERTQRFPSLIDVLRRRFELSTDPAEQEALLERMAVVHDTKLSDPTSAIAVYREMLELDPSGERALNALDRIYERESMWTDLADNISRQLNLEAELDAQERLKLRLADLRDKRMNATPAAIEIYRDVLIDNPQSAAAREALERLLETQEHRSVVAEILEPVYREQNEFAKLIGVYELQVKEAQSPEQRVELFHRIAEYQELALENSSAAFDTHVRALREDPTLEKTHDQLDRLALAESAYDRLAGAYEALAQDLSDPSLSTSLLRRSATIRENQLMDVEATVRLYERVVKLDPENVGSIEHLERLYQSLERYEDLATTTLAKAAVLSSPEEQKEALRRAASIYEEILDKPESAIEVQNRVLGIDVEDTQALDKLTELYLRQSNWPRLLETYEKRAEIATDADEKKRILFEAGAVYETELTDGPKAIDTYQRVLEVDPADIRAIGKLDVLYQQAGNWRELLSILEREADLAEDPDEIISYKYRIAELWQTRLDDSARAVEGYREILESTPDHEPSARALETMMGAGQEALAAATVLEAVYRASGDYPKLARSLEVQVTHEADDLRKVELLHNIAELHESALDQLPDAFTTFARALPLDRGNPRTLESLERLVEVLNRQGELAALYDREAGVATDDAERRIDLLLRAARFHELSAQDPTTAIDRLQQVLAVDELNVEAINTLERLYERAGKYDELADLLPRAMNVAASPDDALDIQYRLGRVFEGRLNAVPKAIEQYQQVLGAAPDHQASLRALENLLARRVEVVKTAEILEPVYRANEAWEAIISVNTIRLSETQDVASRRQIIESIVDVYLNRIADAATGFVWQARLSLESPDDVDALAELERVARDNGLFNELAAALAEIVAVSSSASKADIGRRLAAVYETELGDIARAEEAYRYILGFAPSDTDALEALDRIYSEQAAHEPLASVLSRRIAAAEASRTSGPDHVDKYLRLARVLEYDLGRTEESIKAYRKVVDELEPQNRDAIRGLADAYARNRDLPKYFETLERELAVALGDSERGDVLAKMAYVAGARLNNKDRAIELWRLVLDVRGEDREALNQLGTLYAEKEQWRDVVDILDREAAVTDDDATRIAILADMARVWFEKLEKSANSLEAWERVLDIDPSDAEALLAIAAIHRKEDRPHELVDTLVRALENANGRLDRLRKEAVYLELGSLYHGRLEQPLDAIQAYEHALDTNPKNLATIDELERIHRAESDWEGVVRALDRRVVAASDSDTRVANLLEIAKVWDAAGASDRGRNAFEQVLEINPSNARAFSALESLHETAGRHEDLVQLYVSRVEAAETTAERVDLLRRVARVYEKHLNDPSEAYDSLLLAWSEDFTDDASAHELERVAGQLQRYEDLVSRANAWFAEVPEKKQKVAVGLAAARWYGQFLGSAQYAQAYYKEIAKLDPANVQSLRQQADLFRFQEQWQELQTTLQRLSTAATDAAERMHVLVQLGENAEQKLGLAEQALGFYQKAREIDATNPAALSALERVFRAKGQWPELLETLDRRLEVVAPEERVAVLLSIADVYEDRLHDPDKAIDTYRRILEIESGHVEALKGLERQYSVAERWGDLLGILEAQYETAATEREQISLLSRMAAMWEEQFLKLDRAVDAHEKILELNPTHEASYIALERLHRQTKQYDKLVDTYERHISVSNDRSVKSELLGAMGETHAQDRNDPERAIDAYLSLVDIDEDSSRGYDALAKLYEKRGDMTAALEMLEKLARVTQEPERVVDLRYRMGRIHDDQLGDRASAADHFQSALDVDPGHLPSLEAMRKIYVDAADWLSAAKVLEQEAAHTEAPRQVAKLLVELGRIHDQHLEDRVQAVTVYEEALSKDEDNEDASMFLAEEYSRTERFESAQPLLETLVKRAAKRTPDEQLQLWFNFGRAGESLGKDEQAVKAFTAAHQIDPAHLPALQGLASATFRTKDWTNAFKYYQEILARDHESLSREEITDAYYRLGAVKREQGERRKAINMFDKALEQDAQHLPTLEAVVALYTEQNEFEQVVHYKRQMLVTAEGERRVKLLEEIGDISADKLRKPDRAVAAYDEALIEDARNHVILHKILKLHQDARDWANAVATIQRISDLDERAAAKSKYAYTIGVVLRDELKDPVAALDKLNESLDLDPNQLKAFEAINKLLNTQRDWKGLERAYRKMLHRIVGKGNTALEFELWHQLGVIYRDRMNQYEYAAESFRTASALQPDRIEEHQILAELYAMIPDRIGDAVREHQYLLEQDAYRVESHKALYKLFFDSRAYDRAWCVAQALVVMNRADTDQKNFYDQFKVRGPMHPRAVVDYETFMRKLYHPEQDLYLGGIYRALAGAVRSMKVRADKDVGLRKQDQVDVVSSSVSFVNAFKFAAQLLSIQAPRLFLRQDSSGGLGHLITDPPASVAGAAVLSGLMPADQAFLAARHLTMYRPDLYISRVLTARAELQVALLAALRVVNLIPASDPNIEASAKEIAQRLQPQDLDALGKAAKLLIKDRDGKADVKRWIQTTELTACRAGFLVANDLEVARKMLEMLPPEGADDLPWREKFKDVLLFSVSDRYFELREHLGVTIRVS